MGVGLITERGFLPLQDACSAGLGSRYFDAKMYDFSSVVVSFRTGIYSLES